MSERNLGRSIRDHKKAELGIVAAGAVLATAGFHFGRQALKRREEHKKRVGYDEPKLDPKTYEKRLQVFASPHIDPFIRATMAAAAAQLYAETRHAPEHVLTFDDFNRNKRINMLYLPEALRHLEGLIGTRPNPRYMAGEGAEEGYYAGYLDYEGEEGIESHSAPSYAQAVKEYLDDQDKLNFSGSPE